MSIPATIPAGELPLSVGNVSWVKAQIAHDTPNLATGFPIYTPAVDELVLDAWIDALIDWDGTTPQADIGKAGGVNGGLYVYANAMAVPLASDAPATYITGFALQQVTAGLAQMSAAGAAYDMDLVPDIPAVPFAQRRLVRGSALLGSPAVPARITDTAPIVVWVSQDGTYGGADPGSTRGTANVWLCIAHTG